MDINQLNMDINQLNMDTNKQPRQYSVHLKLNTDTLHKLDEFCKRNKKKRNTLLNTFIAREVDRAIRLELAQQSLNFDEL